MRKIYIKIFVLLIGIFMSQQLTAQQMLTGRIADANGEGIPGVTVMIKGTDRGTICDLNGVYSIQVYMGDVLVISFVGMRTREVEITPDNFKNLSFNGEALQNNMPRVITKPIPQYYEDPIVTVEPQNDTIKNAEGVAYLGHNKNRLSRYQGGRNDYGIPMIKNIEFDKNLNSYVFNFERPYRQKVEHFEFNSSFSIDRVTQLPKFQNTYAHGTVQNGQFVYTSPLENNLVSWGPQIALLEYDGQSSTFYANGNIVGIGQGAGIPISTYQPSAYFKSGLRFNNSIEYRITNNNRYFYAKYSNTNNSGIMPGAGYKGNSLSLGYKSNKLDTRAFYTLSHGNHNLQEANYARILHTLYTTPPEFDNANGWATKQAIKNQGAYLTSSDRQRSYAANQLENPYWLAANDPSKMESEQYGANLSYSSTFLSDWKYQLAAGFRNEKNVNTVGFVSFYSPLSGILNEKDDANLSINGEVNLNRKINIGRFELDNYVRYLINYNQYKFGDNRYSLIYALPESIDRDEAFVPFSQQNNRLVNEIVIGQFGESQFHNLPLNYALSLNVYQSSTCENVQWLPNTKIIFDFHSFDNWLSYNLPGRFYVQYAKTLSEIDFQNRPNHFNTINFNTVDFRNYNELKNVLIDDGIKPVVSNSFYTGISFQNIARLGIELGFDYYYKKVGNAIFPLQNSVHILMANQANLISKGFEARLYYHRNFYNASILFSQNKNMVEKINSGDEIIPIAGFNDVYKSLIEGQEVGVIVGSRYSRNETGQLIIGNDGFPMVDPNPGIIGNPNPDWVMNFNNTLNWRRFDLEINLEYKHGGQVWNGTKNVLNYHGVSQQSADSRNVIGYVFEGVNQNGEPNTIAVDFANPANDINEFRYLRYGYAGVAEDAIENASCFRIKKIALSYELGNIQSSFISLSGLKLSCWVENLLTITPYSGVDPQSSLFGYDSAQGLDFFNAPAVRRFGFNLNVTF